MAHSPKSQDTSPRPLTVVQFVKPKAERPTKSTHLCICSTLYNPMIDDYPENIFLEGIEQLASEHDLQIDTCVAR